MTSKRFADQHLVPLLEGVDYAYYHVDNRDKRCELEHIAEAWTRCSVVMFTPCINVGCDFSVEGHFDEIWAMASSQSAVPRELLQMLVRCRKPRSATMHVLVRDVADVKVGPTTANGVLDALRRKAAARDAVEEAVVASWTLGAAPDGRLRWVVRDAWLTHAYAHTVAEQNRARSSYVRELERLAAEKQYRVVEDRVELSRVIARQRRARTHTEIDDHRTHAIAAFDAAPEIDDEDVESLQLRGTERAALLLRKHDYCSKFVEPVDGQHWWDCHDELGILFNVRRLRQRTAQQQYLHETGARQRHVALHPTHFERIHALEQLAESLGLDGPLDTDTVVVQAAWANVNADELAALFGTRTRTTPDTPPWKCAKTVVNQVLNMYIGASFRRFERRAYKLRFRTITGNLTVLDVANQMW